MKPSDSLFQNPEIKAVLFFASLLLLSWPVVSGWEHSLPEFVAYMFVSWTLLPLLFLLSIRR